MASLSLHNNQGMERCEALGTSARHIKRAFPWLSLNNLANISTRERQGTEKQGASRNRTELGLWHAQLVLSPHLLLPYNSKSSAPSFPWRAGQLGLS